MIGAAVIALACVLVGAGLAHAAQYRVTACGATANYVNHLFSASTSDNRMNAYTACPNDGNGHPIGVAASAGIERGKVPVFWNATQSFVAPAGTTIHHVHVKAEGRTWNGDWTSLLQASNDRFGSSLWNLSGCGGNPGSVNGCVSAADKIEQNYDIPGATGVRTLVSCGNFNGCTTFSTDVWPFTRAYYYVRDFDVTLDDPSVPSVSVTGGALASGKWTHGTQGLSFGATDNSGILRTQFSVDDLGTIASNDRSCDYTFAVPCSNVTNGWYEFDTNRLADGPHRVAAVAVDATDSNVASVAQTIYVDNHAPAEPVSPSVVGGEGWHNVDGFTVNWTNPPSAAPIERATYELCKSDGSGCITGSATGTGVHQISNVRVGQPGDYTIRVWLTDAAENESPAKTAPLHLKFDNVPPAQAAPQHRNGWVSASEAKSFDQEIDPPVGGAPPVSGIAGYAVTSDGSVPGWETNTRASDADNVGHRHLENLPEGVTTVRARAISGSGVGSPDVGSTDIHVDLSAPHVTVEGQPEPNRWSQRAAALRFTAVEDGLSGMASGPDDRGAESGGFIELSVDGAAAQRRVGPRRDLDKDGILEFVPTATIDLPITADGLHAVSYRAVDVAGNEGAEKSVGFKIDQTPPELAVFEAQQQSDPQLVTVAASDRTSGLADGGRIQLRRIEPNRGAWITLRTTRQDDRYYAHLENATLPEGDYQFRATIPDQAGNEATAVNDREGREEVLHITPTQVGPYPTGSGGSVTPPTSLGDPQDAKATVDTVIAAAAVQKTVTRKKCKSRSRGKKCTRVTQSLVHDLRVGFGKRAMVKGRLTTSAGTGIAGAEITVLARPAMAGGTYTAEGTVRTNGTGEFAYTAPVGPGRALDFHFRGDDTYKHADDQVTLRVPASVSIKVNRHTVRNGKRVRFTGRLQGKPYPPKGKILDLQAFYRHRWRTFATPRAALNGKWTYNYRFQATRGTVLYKFRVRVRATSDYPYELGYSKATDVRVVGR
jgi:hypothetical protein